MSERNEALSDRSRAEWHEGVVVDEFKVWRRAHERCRVSRRKAAGTAGDVFRCLDHKEDFAAKAETAVKAVEATPFDVVVEATAPVAEVKPKRAPAAFKGRRFGWLVEGGQ